MKFFYQFVLLLAAASAYAEPRTVLLGNFDVIRGGIPKLNGVTIGLPAAGDGSTPIVAEQELYGIGVGGRKKYALLSYWDEDPKASSDSYTNFYVVVDFTGKKVVVSNPFNARIEVKWADNNYVFIKDDELYFGVYKPRRIQFIYKNGVLKENTGPWAGPAKPERYIDPEESPDPCFNVSGVEECRAEQARDAAQKKHDSHKSTGSATHSTTQPSSE